MSEAVRNKGVAWAMCEHSQDAARRRGLRGMQFNLVASTNAAAGRLWQRLGFEMTLPGAFNHPTHGYVAALKPLLPALIEVTSWARTTCRH